MPELPDLVYIQKHLQGQVQGQQTQSIAIKEPIIIRNLLGAAPEDLLPGQTIEQLHRVGPFLHFEMSDLDMIIHPMLAGRFSLASGRAPAGSGKALLEIQLAETKLRYHDDRRMGKVYLCRPEQRTEIPLFTQQTTDITSQAFTEELFLAKTAKDRRQIRILLMDQKTISALGNAYADEILFDAGIHPKVPTNKLSPDDRKRLYASIKKVIQESIAIIEEAAPELHQKYREHVKVRNRHGQNCPRCGEKIRRASVRGYDSFFCPQCQPAEGTRGAFIDWNKKF